MADRPTSNLSDSRDPRDQAGYMIDRYRRLLKEWYLFGIEAQEIADHILPRKNSIMVQRIAGSKRTQRMYDSTAPKAASDLASAIHGTLTSSYIRWFYLETDDPDLNESQEVADWLEKCSAKMMNEFLRSNFAQEAHEAYIDLVCFGTACLFEEEKESPDGSFGGLLFRAVPYGKYIVAEGPDGHVNAVFRSIPMSAQAIRIKWKDQQSQEVADAKDDTMFEVIHGVYPENERGAIRWKSLYMTFKDRTLLSEGEFKEFPFMVPRWSKLSDEMYGRGPSHEALPDVRSLNKIVELELRRIALDVHPPMMELNGDVIGPIRMVPGGKTSVRSIQGLQPLLTGSERTFNVVNLKKQELVQSIRNIYFADQLQLPNGPQMTAEEVITRMELMERLLGPTAGRLESEFLRPLIDRTWAIMLRNSPGIFSGNETKGSLLPAAPGELIAALNEKKVPLRIRFEGPLARAQKAADAMAAQKIQGFVMPMAQVKPDVLDVIDWDEAVRHTASVLGVPARMILDKDQVQQIRDQRQQQQDQMMQAEQAQRSAQAAPGLMKAGAKAPEPNSPMQQLQDAMGGMGMGNGAPTQQQ